MTFSVFDILDQNTNVSIATTEAYTEMKTTCALGRYYLLTFTHTLRRFPRP